MASEVAEAQAKLSLARVTHISRVETAAMIALVAGLAAAVGLRQAQGHGAAPVRESSSSTTSTRTGEPSGRRSGAAGAVVEARSLADHRSGEPWLPHRTRRRLGASLTAHPPTPAAVPLRSGQSRIRA